MAETFRTEEAFCGKEGGQDDIAVSRKHMVLCWFDLSLGLSDAMAGRLNAQQISSILRVTPLMMGANIFAAILCVVIFWHQGNVLFLSLWAAAFVLTSMFGLRNCIGARSRKTPKAVSKRAIRRVIINSTVPALLWTLIPLVLFADADSGGKLLISSIVIGAICVGLFGLSTIPKAALVYGGIIVVGSVVNMVLIGEVIYYYLSVFLLLYFGVALASVCWNARLFRDRFRREVEAEYQKEYIGFLLAKEKQINELQRQFVSMASHEFRTPLAIIDSAAQALTRRSDKLTPEQVDTRVQKIRAAVQRMVRLMESILMAARMDQGGISIEAGPCNVGEIVRLACDHQQGLTSNHKIHCKLVNLPDTIQADAGALEQVLANLLSNAVKYSPGGSEIDVVARGEADEVTITVRDRGLGIDEDDQSRLFERFFRAKTSVGIAGTGIGLNLAQTLVKLHGGTISVHSRKGEGSTFSVRLPVNRPQETSHSLTKAA